MAFNRRKPPVGRQSPEHFGIKCKGKAHGLDEGRIIPSCSMWLNSAFVALNLSTERRWGRENAGGTVVSMWCFMEWVSLLTTKFRLVNSGKEENNAWKGSSEALMKNTGLIDETVDLKPGTKNSVLISIRQRPACYEIGDTGDFSMRSFKGH